MTTTKTEFTEVEKNYLMQSAIDLDYGDQLRAFHQNGHDELQRKLQSLSESEFELFLNELLGKVLTHPYKCDRRRPDENILVYLTNHVTSTAYPLIEDDDSDKEDDQQWVDAIAKIVVRRYAEDPDKFKKFWTKCSHQANKQGTRAIVIVATLDKETQAIDLSAKPLTDFLPCSEHESEEYTSLLEKYSMCLAHDFLPLIFSSGSCYQIYPLGIDQDDDCTCEHHMGHSHDNN